jgi:hypothetical protein
MKDEMNFRPVDSMFVAVWGQEQFADFNGAKWREQKRFIMRRFRDLGLGKSTMIDHIMEESRHMINDLKESIKPESNETSTLDLQPFFSTASTNMINTLVFGDRMGKHSPAIGHLPKLVAGFSNTGLVTIYPQVADAMIAMKMSPFAQARESAEVLRQYFA